MVPSRSATGGTVVICHASADGERAFGTGSTGLQRPFARFRRSSVKRVTSNFFSMMKNVSFYGGIAAEVGNSRGIVEDGSTKLRKSNIRQAPPRPEYFRPCGARSLMSRISAEYTR